MNTSKFKADLYILVHLILGITAAAVPFTVFYWSILIFAWGLYVAVQRTIRWPEYIPAAYLVGLELLGRMSKSGIPHEFTKYAVSLILLVSIIAKGSRLKVQFILYFLLLLPAAFLTDGGDLEETRQLISGNLSGPLCLAVSAMYFYNFPFRAEDVRNFFLSILYPLVAILGYLIVKTPDFSEIEFGYQSNFATSIYGPNQMSSILGLGILIIGLCYFMKVKLLGSNLLLLGLTGMFLFRGLLTFSRGGMLTPMILLFVIFAYYTVRIGGINYKSIRVIFLALLFATLGVTAFNYANELTGNKLYDRYTGQRGGQQIEDIDRLTSGRTLIMALDWQIFNEHPISGVGVGMGKYLRKEYGYAMDVAAHNEFTRLLAEHGIPGVISLLILVGAPVSRFFGKTNTIEKIFLIGFIGFCFVFMTHAATRIAAPCFLYGFAFIRIVPSQITQRSVDTVFRKYAIPARQVTSAHGDVGAPA
ncbi:MAG: O-antigen ligase family protein [Cyclobacteriaceae bacterium]|nr:O-antigen ligase family protein [Cyclobacteriaceae bacterium]